ncbi:MAG: methyltransferase domain-containing protein [Alphaproteobacteria bacterium]
MADSSSNDSYLAYDTLKGWDASPFMEVSLGDRLLFDHHLGQVGLAGKKVIELGFGNGSFLGWARERGAKVYGAEVQPKLIAKAIEQDVTIVSSDLSLSVDALRNSVALIAAIDVMEHLSIAENRAMLVAVASLLEPGGLLFVRFPNGASPLSLPVQAGDVTHVSTLSPAIVRQLASDLPFSVRYEGAPHRSITGGVFGQIARHIQSALRACATKLVHAIYGRIDLYPNALMILQRVGDEERPLRNAMIR